MERWCDKTGTVCRSRQIRNEGSEGVCDADVQVKPLEMAIDDPGANARPRTFTIPLVFQPDTELMEHACSENNKCVVSK